MKKQRAEHYEHLLPISSSPNNNFCELNGSMPWYIKLVLPVTRMTSFSCYYFKTCKRVAGNIRRNSGQCAFREKLKLAWGVPQGLARHPWNAVRDSGVTGNQVAGLPVHSPARFCWHPPSLETPSFANILANETKDTFTNHFYGLEMSLRIRRARNEQCSFFLLGCVCCTLFPPHFLPHSSRKYYSPCLLWISPPAWRTPEVPESQVNLFIIFPNQGFSLKWSPCEPVSE